MSWYIEPYEGSSSASSSDEDTGEAITAFLGAASGVV